MTFGTALLLIKRALGCRIVGHEWHYWTELENGRELVDHRVCQIAACQRHQVRRHGVWSTTEVGRPGI